jgi:hypothetical protein
MSYFIAAGATFAVAWFIFFDGLTIAGRDSNPYNFTMFLPGVLCVLSAVIFIFVDPKSIAGDDDDGLMGGIGDESEKNKNKITFFLASFFSLAGMGIAVWKMVTNYKEPGQSWPGVALLLQVVAFIAVNILVFVGRLRNSQSDEIGFGM